MGAYAKAIYHFIAICVCLIPLSKNVHADTAKDVVEVYHQQLLSALTAPSSTNDMARYKAISPAMTKAFDFETMIKTVVGRSWSRSDASTRQALLDAFKHVSIATYADQFADLKKADFVVSGLRDGPRGLVLVDSVLKTPGEDVTLIYVVRKKDSSWQIIDVLLDGGISELALRASEYAQILKSSGPEGLITSLNKQANTLLEN